MSFYSKIVEQLNAAVQTKDAEKVALASWDAGRWSGPLLAGERLEVGFPQVLDAAEKGDVLSVKASRFVDENADFLCAFVQDLIRFEITKARIASRLRQESFPRAGDSGFRPCRCIFYQNFDVNGKWGRRVWGIAA